MLVCFEVGEHRYGLPLTYVRELVRMVAVAPLPDAPHGVVGAINLRGRVIPVVSVRARLSLPPREATLTDRIIAVDLDGQTIGLLVDSVLDVVTTGQVEMQTLTMDRAGARTTSVAKVNGRSIPILDLEHLYSAG